jgi:spore germination protein KB
MPDAAFKPARLRPAGGEDSLPLEEGRISGIQLTVLIMMLGMGSSLLMISGGVTGREAWIAMFLGTLQALLFALVYVTLANRFPGKTIVEINDIVYGPYLGKVMSAVFLWYLFHSASIILRNYSDSFTITFLTDTPGIVLSALLMLTCIMAVRLGLEVVARCSQVLISLIMMMYVVWTVFALPRIDWGNYLPLVEIPLTRMLWDANTLSAFLLADSVSFLMIIPFVNERSKVGLWVFSGIAVTGFFSAMALFIDTGVLGVTTELAVFPTLEVAKLIEIPLIRVPLDLSLFVIFIAAGFIRISIYLYGAVLALAQMLRGKAYRTFVIPSGILILLLSIINFDSFDEAADFIRVTAPIYKLPWVIGLPLLTLAVAYLRRLSRRNASGSA